MAETEHYSSGTPWEENYGYSRAVRNGDVIYVSGTVASDSDGNAQGDDVYGQTIYIFKKIERALGELGAGLEDVVRVRAYLTDDGQFEDFGRAHEQAVGEASPANTAVVVEALASEEFLVEIDAVAVVDEQGAPQSETDRLGFRG